MNNDFAGKTLWSERPPNEEVASLSIENQRKPMELLMHGEPKAGRTEYFDEVPPITPYGIEAGIDDIVRQMAEGKAAKDELAVLKPVLAFALSRLPKRQLRVRADEMDTLASRFQMQSKSDGQGGIILRSVTVL